MATRARAGFAQYQRQDLFGGAYGLTGSASGAMALGPADPVALRPDFWVAFLWKRTLGTAVLNASSSADTLRAYAFAGAPPSPHAAPECLAAALQLLLINLSNTSGSVAVTLPPSPAPGGGSGSYAAWTLSPAGGGGGGPFGAAAECNGALLPTAVDAAAGPPPASFLGGIVQPAVTGLVAVGIALPPLSTTFVCY